MSSFYTGPPTEHSLIYDLYGVTNHHGGLMGGHYTAFARCLNADNSTQYGERFISTIFCKLPINFTGLIFSSQRHRDMFWL